MTPTTLTTAFLLTQFFLLLIVYTGILALRKGESSLSSFSNNPRLATKSLPLYVLGFSLITLACISFSQDFILLSQPAFGDVTFPSFSKDDAFLIVFMLNILGSGLLIGITGGSKESPFSAVLFTLPSLAIFLRETPTRFFLYTILAVILFLLFSKKYFSEITAPENPRQLLAFRLITLGCLGLSTLVGYSTRPL